MPSRPSSSAATVSSSQTTVVAKSMARPLPSMLSLRSLKLSRAASPSSSTRVSALVLTSSRPSLSVLMPSLLVVLTSGAWLTVGSVVSDSTSFLLHYYPSTSTDYIFPSVSSAACWPTSTSPCRSLAIAPSRTSPLPPSSGTRLALLPSLRPLLLASCRSDACRPDLLFIAWFRNVATIYILNLNFCVWETPFACTSDIHTEFSVG